MIETFKLEHESEADSLLHDLSARHKDRSMAEVNVWAQKHIDDAQLKSYFINKAEQIVKTYGVG